MINLFPEIKDQIEGVLHSDVLQKNADIELQQRALEYFKVIFEMTEVFCRCWALAIFSVWTFILNFLILWEFDSWNCTFCGKFYVNF